MVGVTPICGLVAFFAAFILQTSGQPEIVLGQPFVLRTQQEQQNLVGYMSNDLPIRFSERIRSMDLRSAAQAVQKELREAIKHSEATYARIVDACCSALGLKPSAAYRPLFQTMVQLMPPQANMHMRGTAGEMDELPVNPQIFERMAEVDLRLGLFGPMDDGSLSGMLVYDTALYRRQTIQRVGRGFEALVKLALKAPTTALGDGMQEIGELSDEGSPTETDEGSLTETESLSML